MQSPNNRVLPVLYQIGVVTLLTSILWASLSLYFAFTSQPDVDVPKELLAPLQPGLDTEFLEELATREALGENVDAELAQQVGFVSSPPDATESGSGTP